MTDVTANGVMGDIITPEIRDTFTTSSGVVLRLKKVSRLLLLEVTKKVPLPKVPVVWIEDKQRKEENPNDPDYIEAVQQAKNERGMVYITTMFSLGSEIVTVPEGIEGPTTDDWLDTVESLGVAVPHDNKRLRYAAWLKYIAMTDETELNQLVRDLFRYSGLTLEEDVADAQDAFRGETPPPSTNGVQALQQV